MHPNPSPRTLLGVFILIMLAEALVALQFFGAQDTTHASLAEAIEESYLVTARLARIHNYIATHSAEANHTAYVAYSTIAVALVILNFLLLLCWCSTPLPDDTHAAAEERREAYIYE